MSLYLTRSRPGRPPAGYRLVETLDVFHGDTQRPELPLHAFGPVRAFDRRSQAVYVFRRVPLDAGP